MAGIWLSHGRSTQQYVQLGRIFGRVRKSWLKGVLRYCDSSLFLFMTAPTESIADKNEERKTEREQRRETERDTERDKERDAVSSPQI